mmetsp:Transcript_69223/g.144286  ORF Transcript_69223/g.144286 Transcript_69223/m.144286 type:complete len:540 (+) Transcript_69223:1397-3016(+)
MDDYTESSNGQKIREKNIKECLLVSNLLKTSFGPISMDKMIIDDAGEITTTNDGANILKRLDMKHPATNILMNLASQQDEEVGDGTTSVVIIATELLTRANELIRNKIHPSTVISAYRLAMCYSCSYIRKNLCVSSGQNDINTLLNTAKTSLSSKISGVNSKKFAIIALQAVKAVQVKEKRSKKICCQIKALNFTKIQGQQMNSSCLVDGFIIPNQKIFSGFSTRISPARIACLNIDLRRQKMHLGIQAETGKTGDIKRITKQEFEIAKEKARIILNSGANVVLTTKGMDDFIQKYFLKNGIIAVRRVSLDNLKKIAMASGAKIQNTLSNSSINHNFDNLFVGEAEEMFDQEISKSELLIIRGCRFCPGGTVLLRGATEYLLDEISQSLYDAIYMVKRTIEGKKIVAGGGSTETSLSIALEKLASSIGKQEQLPILEFSEAIMSIPKTLANNAGLNSADILAKLRILHTSSVEKNLENYRFFGLDLGSGKIKNNILAGIIEPVLNKIRSIQIATEAAITILRVDDFIFLKNRKEKKYQS